MSDRTARIERATKESKVLVEVDLDGTGRHDVSTGVGFYDHMLTAFARHGLVDLTVQTEGDVHIDAHHTVEDTAIVLGQALREALGDKVGIRRFGDATVPLDEALVQAVVDVSGRPYCVHTGEPEGQQYVVIGGSGVGYVGSLTRHVFETLAHHAQIALHVRVLSGRDPHHLVETQFKAVARALRDAIALGDALREALGDKVGIRRFGDATVPLDEALVQAVVDVSGRPYCVHTGEPDQQAFVSIGGDTGPAYSGSLTRHVFETLAFHAQVALHVRVLSGRDPHHLVEAQFKAVARALRDAIAHDPRETGVPSTKGSL